LDEGACLTVKNIGKPCAGKPQARFDEGRLMNDQTTRHAVAACGEASGKRPVPVGKSASYSTHCPIKKIVQSSSSTGSEKKGDLRGI